MKLEDPGKNLSDAQAKLERLKAWSKPKNKADQDKLRAERVADYEKVHGKFLKGKV
jgi:hypothetical protein